MGETDALRSESNSDGGTATESVAVDVHLPPRRAAVGDGRRRARGLTKPFKELSPRYFYDERGSELFEQITELPEYYPTRAERAILEARRRRDRRPPRATRRR